MTPSTAGDITIVGETYTDNWDPANRPDRDGAVPDGRTTTTSRRCSPRTTAWPAASSPPSMPRVSPARCPCRARTVTCPALNRVALGTQTVDVWKDSRLLGQAAGEAAVAAVRQPRHQPPWRAPRRSRRRAATSSPRSCSPRSRSPRTTSTSSSTPGSIDQATLCQGVEPGTVPVCDATAGSAGLSAGGSGSADGHRAGNHGRLTTLTLSMCLRPAPASWRRTHGALQAAP